MKALFSLRLGVIGLPGETFCAVFSPGHEDLCDLLLSDRFYRTELL